jgi:hypothetical protein
LRTEDRDGFELTHIDLQDLSSQYCGHFCLMIAWYLNQGMPLKKSLENFDLKHPRINDRIVEFFFRKQKIFST